MEDAIGLGGRDPRLTRHLSLDHPSLEQRPERRDLDEGVLLVDQLAVTPGVPIVRHPLFIRPDIQAKSPVAECPRRARAISWPSGVFSNSYGVCVGRREGIEAVLAEGLEHPRGVARITPEHLLRDPILAVDPRGPPRSDVVSAFSGTLPSISSTPSRAADSSSSPSHAPVRRGAAGMTVGTGCAASTTRGSAPVPRADAPAGLVLLHRREMPVQVRPEARSSVSRRAGRVLVVCLRKESNVRVRPPLLASAPSNRKPELDRESPSGRSGRFDVDDVQPVVANSDRVVRPDKTKQWETDMRSIKALFAPLGAALALGTAAGCGGGEDGQTDMAKLEPPASAGPGKAASKPLPPPPELGSPRDRRPHSREGLLRDRCSAGFPAASPPVHGSSRRSIVTARVRRLQGMDGTG